LDPFIPVIVRRSFIRGLRSHSARAVIPFQENPYERHDGIDFVRLEAAVKISDIARWRAIT